MAKAWLLQRWEMLKPELEPLSIAQEDQIARICEEEIAAWKARPTMKSLSSLKEPMSDMRNLVRTLPLTEQNSWLNPRTAEREHIALKYLNYSEGDWALMNKSSDDAFHKRVENPQILEDPDRIVAKAEELLSSQLWPEVVVGLALATGRRLSEILKVGQLYPKTLYTVLFSGQLKRSDAILKPYEIPVLVRADVVLAAWLRLRTMIDCSKMETEAIGKAYSGDVAHAAERHFADLIPTREGRSKLFAHLFRAIYPRLAVFYFCPIYKGHLAYVTTILGHYWSKDGSDELLRNYSSSLHYGDYNIGNGEGNLDGRQGIWLDRPGVEILEVFKQSEATSTIKEKKQKVGILDMEKKKDHSLTRIGQDTKSRIDRLQAELGGSQDHAVSQAIDDHYVLQQASALLAPLYELLGTDNPVGAIQAILSDGGVRLVDQKFAVLETSYAEVAELLVDVEADAKKVKDPKTQEVKPEKPVEYLKGLVAAKRSMKQSYTKRHVGKDYSTMTTSALRKTKTTEAAQERFKRATDAILAYNEAAAMPELYWYINAAAIVDLVGGRPADAKEYLLSREDVEAQHKLFGITPGYNRRSILIKDRVIVPEGGPLVSADVEVDTLPGEIDDSIEDPEEE
jgi:hypothetical protein